MLVDYRVTRIAAIILYVAFCLLNATAIEAKNPKINLSVTTHLGDTQSFREGDVVSFYVSLEKDAYITVVYQDAGDRLNVLLPNALHENNFFTAGWFIPIPNEQNPFRFRITPPFGKETLWVFASDKPFPGLTTAGQTALHSNIETVRNTLKKHCRRHNAVFEEASLSITTTNAP